VGSGALKVVFPRLFSLSLSKESKVVELGAWNNGLWVWTFAWRRSLFEWEKQLEYQFSQVVQGVCFDLENEDSWFGRMGRCYHIRLFLPIIGLGGAEKGRMPLCLNSFGDVKPCLLHLLLLGGCWKIS